MFVKGKELSRVRKPCPPPGIHVLTSPHSRSPSSRRNASSRTLQRRQDSHDARPRAQFDHLLASKIHILTLEIVTQTQSL